jgi:hypothetical protein
MKKLLLYFSCLFCFYVIGGNPTFAQKAKGPRFLEGLLKGFLEVEVELELCWMWTQADIIHFFLTLPSNPCID